MDRFKDRAELNRGVTPELCFRRYYANNQDVNISNVLFSYFDAIKGAFVDSQGQPLWSLDSEENILQTTVGYEAMLNVLKVILNDLDKKVGAGNVTEDDKFKLETYMPYLVKAKTIRFQDFEAYPKTSVTKTVLADAIKQLIF